MVKSYLHVVINYLRPSEPDQNMPYLSPYHWQVLNSATFSKNVEILWKWANSLARLKILHSTENCGPLHMMRYSWCESAVQQTLKKRHVNCTETVELLLVNIN